MDNLTSITVYDVITDCGLCDREHRAGTYETEIAAQNRVREIMSDLRPDESVGYTKRTAWSYDG